MAPRHPLPATSTTTPLLQSKLQPSKTLDAVIEHCIGDHFTLSQLLQSTLVSSAWIFDAQQTFISVFSDSTPTWHCLNDDSNNNNSCNATLSKSSKSTNPCLLPESTWAWDQYSTAFTSTVSEYNLACSSSPILKGLPASSFFIGCLVGGLALSTLADTRLGRKNALILSCLLMCSSSLLTALAGDVWSYSALRFLSGVGRATIGTCSLVLSTELVGRRWRGRVGIFGFLAFTVGFMSLPGIAYLNRGGSWRNLYVWTSVPVFVYTALVWLFVPESPRWLLIKGRKEEAVCVLASLAPPPVHGTLSFSEVVLETEYDNNDANVDIYSALKILVRKQWALRRLLSVMTLGVGIGLIYYGMPLALDNMDINLYLGVLLNALSELPSSVVNFLIIDRANRKPSLLAFTCLSGACSVAAAASGTMGRWVQMGAEMLSFFGAITSFNILLIYTLELFPTCVRNSAVAMTRQALVLGGAFGPVVVALGRESGGGLSYGVFGVVIGVCAVAVVPLPETREKPLSDTMEEEEEFKGKNAQFSASFV